MGRYDPHMQAGSQGLPHHHTSPTPEPRPQGRVTVQLRSVPRWHQRSKGSGGGEG